MEIEIETDMVNIYLLKEKFSEIEDDKTYKEEIEKLYDVLNKAYGDDDAYKIIDVIVGGRLSQEGYGLFLMNGKLEFSHRVAYILWKGDIPNGKDVVQTCKNPLCVNPKHLKLFA